DGSGGRNQHRYGNALRPCPATGDYLPHPRLSPYPPCLHSTLSRFRPFALSVLSESLPLLALGEVEPLGAVLAVEGEAIFGGDGGADFAEGVAVVAGGAHEGEELAVWVATAEFVDVAALE